MIFFLDLTSMGNWLLHQASGRQPGYDIVCQDNASPLLESEN
jgi:hypothetical protein